MSKLVLDKLILKEVEEDLRRSSFSYVDSCLKTPQYGAVFRDISREMSNKKAAKRRTYQAFAVRHLLQRWLFPESTSKYVFTGLSKEERQEAFKKMGRHHRRRVTLKRD